MPLTEVQKNALVGFGISVGAGLTVAAAIAIAEALRPPEEVAKHSVSIEATTGGTTDPSPGFYKYDEATSLTVWAITFEGYEFKGWYLNGDFVGDQETLTFTVNEQNLLIASFQEIGAPPLIPAYIKPIQDCRAEEWWRVREEYHGYDSPLWIEHDFFNNGFIKFKICDAAGNGVPGQVIAVYSDPQPDITDYGFVKIAGLKVHTVNNPLILGSDGDGVVSVPIKYEWLEPDSDYKETIGAGGKAMNTCLPIPGEHWHYPLYNGIRAGWTCIWREFVRLLHPLYRTINPIHAYWVDNPDLPVWGDCYADCVIKIEPSKSY